MVHLQFFCHQFWHPLWAACAINMIQWPSVHRSGLGRNDPAFFLTVFVSEIHFCQEEWDCKPSIHHRDLLLFQEEGMKKKTFFSSVVVCCFSCLWCKEGAMRFLFRNFMGFVLPLNLGTLFEYAPSVSDFHKKICHKGLLISKALFSNPTGSKHPLEANKINPQLNYPIHRFSVSTIQTWIYLYTFYIYKPLLKPLLSMHSTNFTWNQDTNCESIPLFPQFLYLLYSQPRQQYKI